MMSQHTKTTTAAALTYARLKELGSLDACGDAPAALEAAGAAWEHVTDAETKLASVREGARTATDGASRRRAQRTIDDHRAALDDAAAEVQRAVRDVADARRRAFEIIVPILQREHAARLPRIVAAFDELAAAADDLREVESLAGNFQLTGASIAPSRSPLPGEFADALLSVIEHWRSILGRARPAEQPAA